METKQNKLKSFIVKSDWRKSSSLNEFGEANGYVVIPKDHPFYGMGYMEIMERYDISVHGGLTFSEFIESDNTLFAGYEGEYVIGFDTCHYSDTKEIWTLEAVEKEATKLAEQCENPQLSNYGKEMLVSENSIELASCLKDMVIWANIKDGSPSQQLRDKCIEVLKKSGIEI